MYAADLVCCGADEESLLTDAVLLGGSDGKVQETGGGRPDRAAAMG